MATTRMTDQPCDQSAFQRFRASREDRPPITGELERLSRALARRLSFLSLAAFGVAVLVLGLPLPYRDLPWYSIASVASIAVVVVGLALAWRWEGLGGSLALIGGVAAGVVAAVQYHPLVAFLAALVFVGPAILFLIAWHRTRSTLSVILLAATILLVLGVGGAVAMDFYEAGFGPSHPESATPALPATDVEWIWSGAVTSDSATVVARVPGGGSVRLAVSPRPDLSDPVWVEPVVTGATYRFAVSGLEPATSYGYAVEVDGRFDMVRNGVFSTFADGPFDFAVAVGGCARLHSNGAVYDVIRQADPDLMLMLGDFYYGDIGRNSVDAFRDAFAATLTQPAQDALYRSVPIAYVWDDHDFGPDNADSTSPAAPAAHAAFRELVPHYPLALAGDEAPIAQAFTVGRVRFILTDGRAAKTVTEPRTMLGDEQLDWLEAELLDASQRYPVVVLATDVPWIAAPEEGGDDWGGYPEERARIAAFIEENGIDNLIMLAGDAHMVAIDDGSNSGYGPSLAPAFPVMHAAALDRVGSFKGGPYSEGAFPGGGQYGLVEVTDDGGATVKVRLSGHTWDGEELTALELEFPAEPSS